MTPPSLVSKLEKLAKKALKAPAYSYDDEAFMRAINPEDILKLTKALRVARRALREIEEHCEHMELDDLCECSTRMSLRAVKCLTDLDSVLGEKEE